MQATIETSIVYDYLSLSNKKITVLQGGARSGKTYSVLIYFVIKLLNEKGKVLTICRQSMPALKGTSCETSSRYLLPITYVMNAYTINQRKFIYSMTIL